MRRLPRCCNLQFAVLVEYEPRRAVAAVLLCEVVHNLLACLWIDRKLVISQMAFGSIQDYSCAQTKTHFVCLMRVLFDFSGHDFVTPDTFNVFNALPFVSCNPDIFSPSCVTVSGPVRLFGSLSLELPLNNQTPCLVQKPARHHGASTLQAPS